MSAQGTRLRLRVAELRQKLEQLEAELLRSDNGSLEQPQLHFSDFYGVLEGKLDTSEEALERARYKIDTLKIWAEDEE